jgi:hypothetical protein
VKDQVLLSFAAKVHDFLRRLEQKPGEPPTAGTEDEGH